MTTHDEAREGADRGSGSGADAEDLQVQVRQLEDEVSSLRRRMSETPRNSRLLEERLAEAQSAVTGLNGQNERLVGTLREAREQILALREEIDRLSQPPSGFGVFLTRHEDGTVDIFTGGRKLRVSVSPDVETEALRRGQEVMLNEAMNVVLALQFERQGEVVMFKEASAHS
jgi:proteasome-associated ATPase